MTFTFRTRLLTTEEYRKMADVGILSREDKVELIEGQIVEMCPIGSRHAFYVNKLSALLIRLLPEEFITSIQNPVILDHHSEPEPDIAVLKAQQDGYEFQLPTAHDVLLLIEIADTSLEYDREVKISLYAKANIPEYWIVDIENRQIEMYHGPQKDQYRYRELVATDSELHIRALGLKIAHSQIFDTP